MKLTSIKEFNKLDSIVYLGDKNTNWQQLGFEKNAAKYVKQQIEQKNDITIVNNYDGSVKIAVCLKKNDNDSKAKEKARHLGSKVTKIFNQLKIAAANVTHDTRNESITLAFVEGMALTNYQFLKYKKEAEEQKNSLTSIGIHEKTATAAAVQELENVIIGVFEARTLVNEPLSFLTAEQLSNEIKRLSKDAKFKLKVFNKSKITSLKMGGLLAVNKGSVDPPTFNVLEWKPKNAVNKKPFVLVGKGVVYDTGGLSLKGTANSMDHMKCDMGGAAAVIGAIYSISKSKLPLYVVGLVPATDNRPGGNAYVPGDIITMHSGATVEVLNTDAEGRMLLADALSYAKTYDPELVIDLATLTGASLVTIGTKGVLLMSNAAESEKAALKHSGNQVHERLVELPLWDEYQDDLKSTVADIKNIGIGRFAGSITAGKFLEFFTDYPWCHLDIAPMGWTYQPEAYRLKEGSGVGVRLLYHFLKEKSQAKK